MLKTIAILLCLSNKDIFEIGVLVTSTRDMFMYHACTWRPCYLLSNSIDWLKGLAKVSVLNIIFE